MRSLGVGRGFPSWLEFDSTCWLGGRPAWMSKSYSKDLRERVVMAVDRDGLSRREAAARFGVSYSAAIEWVKLPLRRWAVSLLTAMRHWLATPACRVLANRP